MSYILDALKKSSEERRKVQQQEELQQPLPFDTDDSQPDRKGRNSVIILLSIFILIAGASWWFVSSSKRGSGSSPLPLVEQPSESETLAVVEPSTTAAAPSPETAVQKLSVPLDLPANEPAEASGKPSTAGLTGHAGELPLQQELPLDIRSQIPEMKFSGHVFSENPALRMILVNTNVVREGDHIDAELKLLEITQSGLKMEFRGNQFRVELF